MFDFGAFELLVVGIVALVVIGPKELPGLLRQIGMWVGKMRRMATEFQEQFSEAINDSEMGDIKKDMEKLADETRFDMDYDPVEDTEREIRDAMEGSDGRKKADRAGSRNDPDYDDDPDDAMVDFDEPPRRASEQARKPDPKPEHRPETKPEQKAGASDVPANAASGAGEGDAPKDSTSGSSASTSSNSSSSQTRSGAA